MVVVGGGGSYIEARRLRMQGLNCHPHEVGVLQKSV